MEQETINTKNWQGQLILDYLPGVNSAMLMNGVKTITRLQLENDDERDWGPVQVTLSGEGLQTSAAVVDQVLMGNRITLETLELKPDMTRLMEMTEAVQTHFTLTVEMEGRVVHTETHPLTLMAYDQWSGTSVMPELLASFVTPNHPALSRVSVAASKLLEKWTGSSALDEYQTQDRNRVRQMVAAVYEALRAEGIVYSAVPASFEETGQRVRLPERVLSEKLGTCLDLTLLFASALENMGIFPLLVLQKGHIFVGAWLTEDIYAQCVGDDPSFLLRNCADGLNNIVVLETTAVAQSSAVSFEEAVHQGESALKREEQFECFIDVHRCRLSGIRPLPQRVEKDGKWVLEGLEHEQATEEVKQLDHFALKFEDDKQPVTKQTIWERKLLDFSLRNNLLNTKLGKRVIPFISFEIDRLEDLLQDGESYHVLPCPVEGLKPQGGMYDSPLQATNLRDLVVTHQLKDTLVSYLSEAELKSALKFIYRTARTSMEENGANSLFMALGMLRWYENDKSIQPRYSPILLLPVDIIRKGGATGYVIRSREEDIILNTTLVEMLKQEFRINLGVMNPLPTDDHGVDVKRIFAGVRQAIAGQKRWNVLEEALLGLFSFSKFVMWNDIHSGAEKLKENQVIATLMEQKLKWQDQTEPVDARQMDKEVEPKAYAIPMDVDSSQMEAVIMSGEGKSFILHGPPGTGKSQTITNMIANALYQGKRVLFVAEKMVALSVVEKRLTKVGLEPFCLELHSNKVTKSHFLSQMEKALNAIHIARSEDYEKTSAALFEHRKKLIANMEALHRKHENGFSLYDCISGYVALKGGELYRTLPPLELVNPDKLEAWGAAIETLDTVFQITGHPADHPLCGLEPKDARKESLDKVESLLKPYAEAVNGFMSQSADGDQRKDYLHALETCAALDAYNDARDTLLSKTKDDVLKEKPALLREEMQQIAQKWFLPRFFAKRSFMSRIKQVAPTATWDGMNALIGSMENVLEKKAALAKLIGESHALINDPKSQKANEMRNAYHHLQDVQKQLDEVAVIPLPEGNVVDYLSTHVEQWLAHFGQAREWCQWTLKKHELEAEHLQGVTAYIVDGHKTGAEAANALKRGVYHQLSLKLVDADDDLRMFNGLLMEDLIKKYRQETSNFQELTKKELYYRLVANIPSPTMEAANSSEMGILKRNIANGGRGMSIRKIMDQIPTLLPRLCPCMLMSPISVAQFIDLNAPKFDLVIFDEASQMPTSEAVGAIARGKALVVVGDPMQMPPTSFFETSMVDEDEAELDDMDSILDDCITLSIPSRYLTWHYRSKHESLIAFSNVQYYDGKLYTFPSVDDRLSKVRLVQVEGTYDKGHTRSNAAEAKAIVEEVIRRLKDEELSKYSIGIVSFSKVQQNLIEDVLTDELAKYPDLEAKAYGGEEPIFIKNLENVQGDERDVILFSVGYGPDKYGHVSMNFGPLNNEGGERRLNVAVSRSRYEMIIFSTLKAEQIDLRRSQAKGVIGLKKFLEFAERGMSAIPAIKKVEQRESILIGEIAAALEERGLKVDTMVGKSNFKVDIAVLNPDKDDEYVMGILCDGKNYYDTPTTRDREICQPNVMNMLGWEVMRVWAVDWFENRTKVIDRIVQRVEEIRNPKPAEKKEEPAAPVMKFNLAAEKPVVAVNDREKKYEQLTITKYRGVPGIEKVLQHADRVKTQVQQLVKAEQPITNTYIYKRIAQAWVLPRVTPRLQELVDQCLLPCYKDPRSNGKNYTFWADKSAMDGYHFYRVESERDAQDIPEVEWSNLALYIVGQQVSLSRDDLKRMMAKQLGFRMGTNIETMTDAAISGLLKEGKLKEINGVIYVKD